MTREIIMDDKRLLTLYLARNEEALVQTQEIYGHRLSVTAGRILPRPEDAEEIVNDTLLEAWQSIPPHKPEPLFPFLCKICKRRAIDRLRRENAQKRGGSEYEAALEEWEDSLTAAGTPQEILEEKELARAVEDFIRSLKEPARGMLIRRYFYLDTVPEIARRFHTSTGRVTMLLARSRRKLGLYLKEKEWTV